MSCRQSYICNTWFDDFFLIRLGLIILLGLWALLRTHKSARLCNASNSYQTMMIRLGLLSNCHRPWFGLCSSVNTKNCCLYFGPQTLTCFHSLVYSDLSIGQLTVFTGYIWWKFLHEMWQERCFGCRQGFIFDAYYAEFYQKRLKKILPALFVLE